MRHCYSILGFCIIILLSGCKVQEHLTTGKKQVAHLGKKLLQPFTREVTLDMPKKNEIQKETQKNHWRERKQTFVLVGEDNLPIYATNNDEVPPIRFLNKSDRVQVIAQRKKNSYSQITWLFLASVPHKEPLGWTEKSGLIFKNNFRKIRYWENGDFSFKIGNYTANFKIYNNGSFINSWTSSGQGLHLEERNKGHLFEFGEFVYSETKNFAPYTHFFLRTDTGLRLENRYKDILINTEL